MPSIRRARRRPTTGSACSEHLEPRRLLSSAVVLDGTASADRLLLVAAADGLKIRNLGTTAWRLNGEFTIAAKKTRTLPLPLPRLIYVDAAGGNDRVTVDPSVNVPVTILGGSGRDRLVGGPAADQLYGGSGDDSVLGSDGADLLEGSKGNDTLDGGAGSDSIAGGAGVDSCLGGEGSDAIGGGDEADVLLGGPGGDVITGDASAGNAGGDRIEGGDGNDLLFGGGGGDVMAGGGGDDSLFGGAGNLNYLEGGPGQDLLVGGPEVDFFANADAAADTLVGGAGIDRRQQDPQAQDAAVEVEQVFQSATGVAQFNQQGQPNPVRRTEYSLDLSGLPEAEVTILSGAAVEIALAGGVRFVSRFAAEPTYGNGGFSFEPGTFVSISGGVEANVIRVAAAADAGVSGISLAGAGGDDRLDASALAGPVTLDGGDGQDTLLGGSGDDLLLADDGLADVVDGGAGSDTLDGDGFDAVGSVEILN